MTRRYSIVPPTAAQDARLSAVDFRVLIFLGGFNENDGFAVYNRTQIAAGSACAPSSVPRAVRRLEEFGYIERQQRLSANGRILTNAYRTKAVILVPSGDSGEFDTGGESDTRIETAPSTKSVVVHPPKPQDVGWIETAPLPASRARVRDNLSKGLLERLPPLRNPSGFHSPAASEPPTTEAAEASPPSQPKPKRAFRMPPDWTPSEDARRYGLRLGFEPWEIDAAALDCREFWLGESKARIGWDGTFKRRLRDIHGSAKERQKLKLSREALDAAPMTSDFFADKHAVMILEGLMQGMITPDQAKSPLPGERGSRFSATACKLARWDASKLGFPNEQIALAL